MIHLDIDTNERVLMIIHRHWIAIIGNAIIHIFLLFVPFVAAPALIRFGLHLTIGMSLFFFIIYLLIIVLSFFIVWTDYYLDVWIITTDRIIDVKQQGMFQCKTSEFVLENIQDVMVDTPGLVASYFGYGNLRVQTASGQSAFMIWQSPHVDKVKDLILDYARKKLKK